MVTETTRLSSIVFKTLIFLLAFFIFSIAVLIFSFMYGIKFNNLSFSGINIRQLYLKYDKKLFLQISDLDYGGKRLDCNASIGNDNQKYIVDIENFYYQNLKMNFSGKLLLSGDEIKELKAGTKKDLALLNASVTFDQALAPVLSEKLFLQFKNDINLRFLHPTLDGVKLDNSTVDIVDLAHEGVLKIYLDIYNMLDLRVLKVLGNYEVELPLKQVGGDTHTIVTIDIPFSKDLGTVIVADAKVKNGVVTIGDNHLNVKHTPPNPKSKTKVKVHVELENNKVVFDDYAFHSDTLFVDYENKTVKVSSKQNSINQKSAILATIQNLNAKLKNNILQYAVDVKDNKANFVTVIGDTNLDKQITNGELYMNHLGFENKAVLDGEKITFTISHKPLNVSINGDFGVDVKLENNESKKVEFKNFTLGYKNNIANLNTNISEENNRFTLNNITNLDKNITSGNLFISNFHQKNLVDIENQTIKYKVIHQPLEADVTSNFALTLKGKNILFDNFVVHYKDKIATLNTNILESKNSLRLENITNLDKNISTGKIDINTFAYEDIAKMQNQTLHYKVEHEPLLATINGDIEMFLKDKGQNQEKKISFANFVARYENNTATVDTNILENKNKITLHDETSFDKDISKGKLNVINFQYEDVAKLENQTINFEVKHQPLQTHITSDLKVTLFDKEKDREIFFGGLDAEYNDKNIVKIKTNINEGNSSFYVTNTTNLDTKFAKGNLNIKSFAFQPYLDLKDEFIQYSLDFKDGIKATVPKYLLVYEKDSKNKQTLNIGKLNNLLDKINYIENKKLNEGTLYLSTPNDFKEANIIINDLGVDINSTLFTQGDSQNQKDKNVTDENQTSKDLPKIALKLFNSKVTVDGYDINATSIFANTNKKEVDLKYLPQDENSTIRFHKNGDIISLKANDLSERFIENFLKKDILDKGLFTIDVDGNKTDLYGGIYVRDTTVKNVRILNNLISFINTTPAIITPILALPTLFRMGETGFDMTGYPIRDGFVKFGYKYDTKMLTIPSFYTRSKMMDFKGKGYVDIANKKLEAGIDVIFLKDYSKFFNHIPLVGYIITGEDGNFVTNVDINGTFETQDFTTHAISNAAEGVVNMIKRTISIPFMPFMDNAKKDETTEANRNENENNTTKEGN